MGKVSMMGTISCQEGKGDELEVVLTAMVEAAREEPGTEIYSYHRAEDDTFFFFALMTDEEAMKNHAQTDAMKAAMEAFMPLMADRPQMTVTKPVAAIGFEV